jgi:CRP/FNR family transcriptional regulator, cyclic AMP receptor protein
VTGPTTGERARALAQVPLFAGMTQAEKEAVAARLSEADLPEGALLVREGDRGQGMLLILEGQADVVRDGRTIASLGPGQFVGELSVIDGGPRIANVIARSPVKALALSAWDLEDLLEQEPAVARALVKGLAARLRDVIGEHHWH